MAVCLLWVEELDEKVRLQGAQACSHASREGQGFLFVQRAAWDVRCIVFATTGTRGDPDQLCFQAGNVKLLQLQQHFVPNAKRQDQRREHDLVSIGASAKSYVNLTSGNLH